MGEVLWIVVVGLGMAGFGYWLGRKDGELVATMRMLDKEWRKTIDKFTSESPDVS